MTVAPEPWAVTPDGVEVPSAVVSALAGLGDASAESVVRFRQVPVGCPPATPSSPTATVAKDATSEMVLAAVAAVLGDQVGYAQEHGGDLVQNIVPTPQGANRQVSTSSTVLLELHTEAAFHPHRPRYLLLLCLRGDPSAGTTVAPADAVAALLHPTIRRVLAQPRFTTGIDESYVDGGAAEVWRTEPHPVLWQDGSGRWCCRYDALLTAGVDVDAACALAALASAARCALRTVVLATGDLLVVDNLRAVHGRSPFEPRFDGTDRWLQRSFVIEDLARVSSDERDGAVIATRFS